jgi:hypothetical protein
MRSWAECATFAMQIGWTTAMILFYEEKRQILHCENFLITSNPVRHEGMKSRSRGS